MGVSINIKIVGVNENGDHIFRYSTGPCDSLAGMLESKDWHHRTKIKLSDILTSQEIDSFYFSHDMEGASFMEYSEYRTVSHNYTPQVPEIVLPILEKIKFHFIKEFVQSGEMMWEIYYDECLLAIKVLSEMKCALEIARNQNLKVILTVVDY